MKSVRAVSIIINNICMCCQAIVVYLHQLPAARKSVPELLSDPIALVRDVRTLVEQHRHDKQALAVTGVPVLKGTTSFSWLMSLIEPTAGYRLLSPCRK